MHSAPPNGSHLDFATARREVRRLKPLIEQARTEIAALEATGGKLANLRANVAELEKALEDERAKAAANQDQNFLTQGESILAGMRPELLAAEQELANLRAKLSGYEGEHRAASEALLAGAGAIERPSAELLKANENYSQAIKERDDALNALKKAHRIEGIEEVMAEWLPIQPEITVLKKAWDTQEAGGAAVQISAYLKLGKLLTVDKNEKIVAALSELPKVLSPDSRSTTAERVLEKYRIAYEAYEKAIAIPGATGNIAASDAFIEMEDAVSEFDQLTAANELTAAQLDPLKAAYEAARTAEAAKHHQKILDAERELFAQIPDDRARKLLVEARVGTIPAAVEVLDAQALAAKEAIKDKNGQAGYFAGVLEQLCIPLSVEDLETMYTARKVDAQNAVGSLGKGKALNTKNIIEALKKDISVMLGLVTKPQERKASDERLARFTFKGPDARLLKALELATEPLKGVDIGTITLEQILHTYLDQLIEGDDLVKDPAKFATALKKDILPLLTEKIPGLFSGEIQKEQADKNVDPAKRALSPDEYVRLIIEIEGGKITTSGPDPVAVRAAETAWVEGFYKSVKQAKEIEELNRTLRDAKAEFDRVKAEANVRPDAAREKQLVETLAKLDQMTAKVNEVFAKRGTPRDPDTAKTERNTFKAKEKDRLNKKEQDLRDAETATETKLEEARDSLKAHQRKVNYKDHAEALKFAKEIVDGLEQLEKGTAPADFFDNKERKAWLAEITDFSMNGSKHEASNVVDQIVHRAQQTPFAIPLEDDPAHPGKKKPVDISKQRMFNGSTWIPRTFYGKTLEDFMKQPNGVASFYELLKIRTEKVRNVAHWFVTNAKDETPFRDKVVRVFASLPPGTELWSWPNAGLITQAKTLVTEGLLKAEYADPRQTTPDIMAKACLGAIAQFMKDDFPVDPPTLTTTTPLNKALFEETAKKLESAAIAIEASREFVRTKVIDVVKILEGYKKELPSLIAHVKKDQRLHALELTMKNLDKAREPFLDAIDQAEKNHNDAQVALGDFLTVKNDQLADALDLFDQKTHELAIDAAKTVDPAAERLMQDEARLRQELEDLRNDPTVAGDRSAKRNSVKQAVSAAVAAVAALYERSATIRPTAQPTEFETRMISPLLAKKKPTLATYLEALGIKTTNAKDLRDWWAATQADPKKLYTALNPTFPDLFPAS